MRSARPAPASRAGRPPDGRPGLNPDDRIGHLDRLHGHTVDRGEQQLIRLRQHFVHGEGLPTAPHSGRVIPGGLDRRHTKIDSDAVYVMTRSGPEPGLRYKAGRGGVRRPAWCERDTDAVTRKGRLGGCGTDPGRRLPGRELRGVSLEGIVREHTRSLFTRPVGGMLPRPWR
jgi:hypothetical protein